LEAAGDPSYVRARVVLACDGVGRPGRGLLGGERWASVHVAPDSKLGFSLTVPQHHFRSLTLDALLMCLGGVGYVGLVETSRGMAHVGGALSPRACHNARGPLPVIQAILARNGIQTSPDFRLPPCFCATGPLTAHRPVVGHGRVMALGDAAGYVEPFTGEGISWAIQAAQAAWRLLPDNPNETPDNIGDRWNDHYHERLQPRQRWCRALRPILGNALGRAGVGIAGRFPAGAAYIARQISAKAL
jgi:2-polyprenyl-6-methoxyphenol hydroxylase-like FAD-dependent oxidoreductase